MSKKHKKECSLAEDFQAVTAMIPNLKSLIKTHEEIAEGYQKYRKNGGAEIPGIEKHLGFKEQNSECCKKTKEIAITEVLEDNTEGKKTK